MTYLYKDPANAYIPWANILELSVKKTCGENIEEDLSIYRELAKDDIK